jgi:hypothetical protein
MHFAMKFGLRNFLLIIPSLRNLLVEGAQANFSSTYQLCCKLFDLFWPFTFLQKIVIETNRFATFSTDAIGNTRREGNG